MTSHQKPKKLDFFIPGTIVFGLMVLFYETDFDKKMASLFYSSDKGWIYRDHYFLEKILHKGGVLFSTTVLVVFVGCFLYFSLKRPLNKKLRDYFGFVSVASIGVIVLVFLFKRWSTLPCPWNVLEFGGVERSPSIWEMFSSKSSNGHCFPAGHSSGAYAFLSMYFAYLSVYGKKKYSLLLPGALIGAIFGLTQQARGAHFMSHDMATIFITILVSWVTSRLYFFYDDSHEA